MCSAKRQIAGCIDNALIADLVADGQPAQPGCTHGALCGARPKPAALLTAFEVFLPLPVPCCREVCSRRCRVFDVPGSVAEDVADVLMAYGAQSVSIEEYRPDGAAEQEIFVADRSAAETLWERCTVVAYFPPEVSCCHRCNGRGYQSQKEGAVLCGASCAADAVGPLHRGGLFSAGGADKLCCAAILEAA
jgi:hypothetical protein